ncbi:MAG: DtxR family transcriptional regulator [Thermoclostridium sp.]|nr:DtxR family transcriptional regulator [Thermoclostridium sp.]
MNEGSEFHTVRGYELIAQENKSLTSAMEDYLEMIYRNSLDTGLLRSNTLSAMLNVHPSSVSKMLQKLSRLGYVDYQKYGIIFLTEKGRATGRFLYRRHQIVEEFLSFIASGETPLVETELIEHHICPETLGNIELFTRFLDENPDCVERFQAFRKSALHSPSDESSPL